MDAKVESFNRLTVTTSDESTLAVADSRSSGVPLVFVHGWAGSKALWSVHAEYFAQNHRVVMLDLAGHGESSKQRETATMAAFSEDVCAVVDALDLKDFVLIGHSMSGGVVLEAARQLGKRIAQVIMVDTFVLDWGRFDNASIDGILAPFREDFPQATRNLIEQTCTDQTPQHVIEQAAETMCQLSPAVGIPALESLLRWNPLTAFQEVDAPIHGINGSLTSEAARERYQPWVSEVVMAGSGHYPHLEEPAKFNQLLQGIIQRAG